jgi:hypothetical protein
LNRKQLLEQVLRIVACRESTAGRAVDVVLDAAIAAVLPVIERSPDGNEVLKRLRSLKSNPKP